MSDAAPAKNERIYSCTVIWYGRLKGYGFMALEGYQRDVLVHNTAVRAGDIARDFLVKGDTLTCSVGLHQGKPCCTNLVMVKPAE